MENLRCVGGACALRGDGAVPGGCVLLRGCDELFGAGEVEERVGVVVGEKLGDSEIEEGRSGARELLGELREALGSERVVAAGVGVEGGSELLGSGLGGGGFAAQDECRRGVERRVELGYLDIGSGCGGLGGLSRGGLGLGLR